ncbi:MAG: TetR/AcrR family transcriptional regulator [Acidimicrobiales bacterium]
MIGEIGGTMVYRRSAAAEQRRDRIREDVLRAARTIVARAGIDGLSMAAVAAEAGVAVGSLYRHFAGRGELIAAVVERTCRRELDVLRDIAAGPEAAVPRLETAVATFTRRALDSGRVASAVICEPTSKEPELLRRRIRAEMATILGGLVADGIVEGALPAQDAMLTGTALVGAVSEAIVDRLAAGGAATTDETLPAQVATMAVRLAGGPR